MTEAFDPDQAANDLKTYVENQQIENDEIRQLVTQMAHKTIAVTYEGINFRILAAVPRSVKELAFDLKKNRADLEENDDSTLDDLLEPTYEILTKLCLDDPWNKVETWKTIDKATGGTDLILEHFLESISNSNKKVKKFR